MDRIYLFRLKNNLFLRAGCVSICEWRVLERWMQGESRCDESLFCVALCDVWCTYVCSRFLSISLPFYAFLNPFQFPKEKVSSQNYLLKCYRSDEKYKLFPNIFWKCRNLNIQKVDFNKFSNWKNFQKKFVVHGFSFLGAILVPLVDYPPEGAAPHNLIPEPVQSRLSIVNHHLIF